MCGLVGFAATSKDFQQNRKKFIKDALFLDTLRGEDATGVLVLYTNFKSKLYKKAIPGYEYIQTKQFETLLNGGDIKTIIAHNRAATMGGKKDHHSHPFHCGNIVLAHNGTLEKNSFNSFAGKGNNDLEDIDSFRITASINAIGGIETLKNIRGAYALTWYNLKDKTLNIARNSLRTLFIGKTNDKKEMLWASEKWMLENLAKRNNIPLQKIELLPTHKLFTFKLNDSDFIKDSKSERYTPRYPSLNYNNSYKHKGWSTSYDGSPTLDKIGLKEGNLLVVKLCNTLKINNHYKKNYIHTKAPEKVNAYFDFNRKDDPIKIKNPDTKFIVYNLEEEKIKNDRGKFLFGTDFLLKVKYAYRSSENKKENLYVVCEMERIANKDDKELWYKVKYVKDNNEIIWDVDHLVYNNPSHYGDDGDDDNGILNYIKKVGTKIIPITKKHFESLTIEGCLWCGNYIDPNIEDGSTLQFTAYDKPICADCVDDWQKYNIGM